MSRDRGRSAARPSIRDRVRQRAEENKFKGGSSYIHLPEGVKFYSLDKGTHGLNILPYEVTVNNHPEADAGELWYKRPILVHRGIGAEEKRYICPRTIKKPCPICDHRAIMLKDPHADEDAVQALKPQDKDLFNIDCGKEGIQILEFSNAMFTRMLEEECREGKDEWSGFADLEGGYTVNARFTEETFGKAKFLKCSRIDFEERDDYPESILDKVVNLDECLVILPYDKLEKIFLEVGDDDEPEEKTHRERRREPEPEPEKPSRRREPEPEPERPARRREPEPEPEPRSQRTTRKSEPEPEPEKPSRRREPESKKNEPICPAEGGIYGESCDDLEECYTCDLWESCRDAKDELEKNKKRR